MMKNLSAIIYKNFKILLRSKQSSLIIVFGPLLLILLVGIAYHSANAYSVRMSTYSASYSPLAESIISSLAKQDITITRVDSADNCQDSVRKSINHVCALFPADLSVKSGGEILFYVDNSKINLVYVILDKISKEIGTKTKELSTELIKTVIDTLDFTEHEITDKQQLVQALQTTAASSDEKVTKISSDLSSIDLSFDASSFRFATILQQLETSKLENTTKDALLGEVTQLQKQVTAVGGKLQQASTALSHAKDGLTLVKAEFGQSSQLAGSVGTSFEKIGTTIKNVKATSIGKLVSPIDARVEPMTAEKSFINYLFPTLVVLIVMFVCLLLASLTEIREKTSKVFFKNFITPTSDFIFILGDFISDFVVILLQLVVLFGVAYFFFKEQLLFILLDVAVVLPVVCTFFIFLGMILGNIFRSEETAAIAAISLSFIMLFFSNAILPIESMPAMIAKISSYNPFLLAETMLNRILLLQNHFPLLKHQLALFGWYILGAFVLVFMTKKIAKRRT